MGGEGPPGDLISMCVDYCASFVGHAVMGQVEGASLGQFSFEYRLCLSSWKSSIITSELSKDVSTHRCNCLTVALLSDNTVSVAESGSSQRVVAFAQLENSSVL